MVLLGPAADSHVQSGRRVGKQGATLGVALFLFGNTIACDPSLVMGPCEPTTPSPYWLAALNAFNTGNNLIRKILL